MTRAWSLITLASEARQYGGNLGHDDEAERLYRYDSFVANHTQLREGDVVFLRDRRRLLGIDKIATIESESGEKTRRRCPTCSDTLIRARKRIVPRWRCSGCDATFADPVLEVVSATKYVATYGATYVPLGELTSDELKAATFRPNDQHSIEELDVAKLLPKLAKAPALIQQMLADFRASENLVPEDASEPETPFEPSTGDTRASVLREIKQRRGQRQFRDALRNRFGDRCAISGCAIVDILEAAHINPYRNETDNHPANGLLLRADLHTLFDLFLIGVEPESLTVRFHPDVRSDPAYSAYEGTTLRGPAPGPSKASLSLYWEKFKSR